MRLFWVMGIKRDDRGIQIALQNGRIATLASSHNSFNYFVGLIEHAMTGIRPTGLLITPDNEILDVGRADNDIVANVTSRKMDVLTIYFQGHDGIFYLPHNHPRFNEIYRILNESNISSQPVWFIAQLPHLNILDVELMSNKMHNTRPKDMKEEVFVEPIAALYRSTDQISDNLGYVMKELPGLAPPDDVRSEIVLTCQNFESALREVNVEIGELEKWLGSDAREPGSPEIDLNGIIELIGCQMRGQIESLHYLVEKLGELTSKDFNQASLIVLMRESAANILLAYKDICSHLDLISARLG